MTNDKMNVCVFYYSRNELSTFSWLTSSCVVTGDNISAFTYRWWAAYLIISFRYHYSRHRAVETPANGCIDLDDNFAGAIHLCAWIPLAAMDAQERLPLIRQHKAPGRQQKEANPSNRNHGGQPAHAKPKTEFA